MSNIILEKFKKDLEKRIITISNAIIKAKSITTLKSIIPTLNKENIWNLTYEEYNQIKKYLTKENQLTQDEEKFIIFLLEMNDEMKKFKKELGFNNEQERLFQSIQEKIVNANKQEADIEQIKQLEELLAQYKNLLNKLNNNDLNTINEFDIIKEIITQNNYTTMECIELYEEINKINFTILKNHGINIEKEEDVLSIESLKETNLKPEQLEELLKKFGIKWEIKEGLEKNKENAEKSIAYYKELLLKYGDYNKMLDILNYLVEKELTFVFDNLQILTKTLIFSSVEEIKKIIEETQRRNMDYQKIIRDNQTILFPPTKSFTTKIIKSKEKSDEQNSEKAPSGSLTHYLKNLELFEELGYSPKEIEKECTNIFTKNPQTIRETIEKLHMYGLSLKYPDGTHRKGFSLLFHKNILDKIDVAIETGCYEYVKDNLTKLTLSAHPFYRVKLIRSLGYTDKDIFREYKKKDRISLALRSKIGEKNVEDNSFGNTLEETFKIYKSEEYNYKNKSLCDEILETSENNTITQLVINNYLIKELDESPYKENELTYNFNGVIISRIKVLRYFQTLLAQTQIEPDKELLLYVITKGSMLNKEELEIIKECINKSKNRRKELK